MSRQLTSRLLETTSQEFQADWSRQRRTAADILRRLDRQEGVILADQVGMGKTYVALAVAVSEILSSHEPRQVLVLTPAPVAEKWVAEWAKLSETLLAPGEEVRCVDHAIRSGEALLAALDDPPERRAHLIVATHTALTVNVKDSFVHLAVLQAAVRGRSNAAEQRRRIARWSGGLRGIVSDRRFNAARVGALLNEPPETWRDVWLRVADEELIDDPVPEAVVRALRAVDLTEVRACIDNLPRNASAGIANRLRAARTKLGAATQATWKSVLSATELTMPLLIVDEAHRLKNDHTQISQLFAPRSPGHDSGALTGIFERMLLLTATPFELGHSELIRVLSRLGAVRGVPDTDAPPLTDRLAALDEVLRSAQAAAINLDQVWSSVNRDHLVYFDEWAPDAQPPEGCPADVAAAWRAACFAAHSRAAMHKALKPWVIRHQRAKRRTYLPGSAIEIASNGVDRGGLAIRDEVALPFLLAARAQAVATDDSHGAARPLFAYGIASSFEAFRRLGTSHKALDTDSAEPEEVPTTDVAATEHPVTDWYRAEIDNLLVGGGLDLAHHPKVKATVERATDLWVTGNKCLVFCWYIRTGQAVEAALRERVANVVHQRAVHALGLVDETHEVATALERLSDRLLRRDSGSHSGISRRLLRTFEDVGCTGELGDQMVDIAVRNMRTPVHLVRYTQLNDSLDAEGLWAGLLGENPAGVNVLKSWARFAERLSSMGDDERDRILTALLGEGHETDDADGATAPGTGRASLQTVRRAHGGTNRETRERLTALFNTPFAPDILVASSVMGEGIDLHRECRHVIHHDLDWNPSVLEQRTGRLDRIGALAELEGRDIEVYEPYLAGTHDEKMYRVVKDRAGWFDVVMGRATAGDEKTTDQEEARVPLAPAIAGALEMNLESSRR